MNWKLLVLLSLFGLAMAFGTVYFIPSSIEPICWGVIMLICAYAIAKGAPSMHFLNGFVLGLFNCVWVTGAHVLLSDRYLSEHPREAMMMANPSMPFGDNPKMAMLVVGPIIGIISGIVIGILAWIMAKLFKSAPAPAAPNRR